MCVYKQLICIGLSITLVIGSVCPAYAAGFQSDGKTLGDYTSGSSSNYPEATANSNIAIANILTASGSGSLYSYIFNISTNTNYLPTIASWLSTINTNLGYLRTDVSNIYTRLAVLSNMNVTLTNIYNQITETLNKVISIDGTLSDIAYFDVGNEDNYRTWTLPELVNSIRLTLDSLDNKTSELKATAYSYPYLIGEPTAFYAKVEGAGDSTLSYQWQVNYTVDTLEGLLWTDSSTITAKQAALVVNTTEGKIDTGWYRCKVTSSDGRIAYTEPIRYDPTFVHLDDISSILDDIFSILQNTQDLSGIQDTLDKILAGIVVLDVLTLWNTVIGTLDFVGIGTSISALGDTMKGVFPFSLVFDVVIIFGLFAADPVTPVFEVPFPDGAGGTYVHTFDMSMFDNLAAAFRVLITVSFCLGLAYVTRNFIFKTGGNE